jgi:predicted nucleic acid-binding Zn ribbon protein
VEAKAEAAAVAFAESEKLRHPMEVLHDAAVVSMIEDSPFLRLLRQTMADEWLKERHADQVKVPTALSRWRQMVCYSSRREFFRIVEISF